MSNSKISLVIDYKSKLMSDTDNLFNKTTTRTYTKHRTIFIVLFFKLGNQISSLPMK